jgi:hypothetical protein
MNNSFSARLQSSSSFLDMWLCDFSNLIYVRLGKLLGILDQHRQINAHQQQHLHWITNQLLPSKQQVELHIFLKQEVSTW